MYKQPTYKQPCTYNNYNTYKKPEQKNCCNTAHCVPGHPLPCPAILKCGTGGGISIPAIEAPGSQAVFPIASVTIDTTCLCDPKVKIEFSSIVSSIIPVGAEAVIRLVFQLSRTVNGVKVPLNTWFYTRVVNPSGPRNTEFADAFSFIFCDEECPGCITYSVDIITPQVLTVGTTNPATVSVTNAAITALAVGCTAEKEDSDC